ncbi:MAG: amino acid permease [Lewinellaceae bacterium]|nr:amino acid permease [Saprospiraceae bacterium]MCB9332086.1 amino acid permease [Lewinellaceae bacterium]
MQSFSEVKKFGTAPVFFTAISTILGAVMFLRFGFAVGNVGFLGTLAIILIGHAVTIPTAMAIAEIATNQKVEGGGEYYIVSRSFGLVIGSTIGIALYLSQAISVAFYIIAFTEAFTALFAWIMHTYLLPPWLIWLLEQKQTIGIPALLGLTYIMLTKGADLGVKTLYAVVATLGIALLAFFVGQTDYAKNTDFDPMATVTDAAKMEEPQMIGLTDTTTTTTTTTVVPLKDTTDAGYHGPVIGPAPATPPPAPPASPLIPIGFFTVFAIIFPAFTGMTAGVGLSGDLKDPGRSIPLGTMAATLTGMCIYVFIAYQLAASASPVALADTSKLVMADIAWQGWWLIPIGLAAATISSALGSIMVAPRTLQAIARDQIFPTPKINEWLSEGKGANDEPFNSTVVTVAIAGAFVLMGALDMVAQVISMFFMVTYGSLCLISFLNHFAADPSYRPRFKSHWVVSLFGALACFGLMFFMESSYALLSIVAMLGLYFAITQWNKDKRSVALIFQGVIFQFSRQLQVFLQKAEKEQARSWRPSAVAVSEHSFQRLGAFHLLRWIAHKYGFGTYIHQIHDYLSRETNQQAHECKERLIEMAESSNSNIYIDTMITPSYTAGISQVIQLPGIAGTENNLLIFEFSKNNPSELDNILDNFKLIKSVDFDIVVLGTSERGYGLKQEIHIWITASNYQNATLMILLAYIIMGHKEWRHAQIKIFAVYPEDTIEEERNRLFLLIQAGQLPISPNNIEFIVRTQDTNTDSIIVQKSRDADLTLVGFRTEAVDRKGKVVFEGYESIGNMLFVNTASQKEIK